MPAGIKAVFFDIDGTLVSFRTHCIPPSAREAVAALREKGIKVYIATGRPLQFIDNLGDLEYDGMVTVTGAYCFTREGKVIYNHPVSQETVNRVAGFLECDAEAYPVIFVCRDELFVTKMNREVEDVARLLDIRMPAVRPPSHARGKDVLQLISFFGSEREACMMSRLMPDCSSMRWHPLFTDVVAAGVSKSTGIDKVLAYEGLTLAQAMAFGDGGNDIPMLSHVPCSVAMGNAGEEVKRVVSYVTDAVDDDGIAHALRHWGLLD